jgi:anti-sigma B factor antagonist
MTSIAVREQGQATVVMVHGDLTLSGSAQELRKTAEELLNTGPRNLIIDLSDVRFVDSAGVANLTVAWDKARKLGGRLALIVAPSSKVEQVLSLTRLNALFATYSTVDAALAAFSATRELREM